MYKKPRRVRKAVATLGVVGALLGSSGLMPLGAQAATPPLTELQQQVKSMYEANGHPITDEQARDPNYAVLIASNSIEKVETTWNTMTALDTASCYNMTLRGDEQKIGRKYTRVASWWPHPKLWSLEYIVHWSPTGSTIKKGIWTEVKPDITALGAVVWKYEGAREDSDNFSKLYPKCGSVRGLFHSYKRRFFSSCVPIKVICVDGKEVELGIDVDMYAHWYTWKAVS